MFKDIPAFGGSSPRNFDRTPLVSPDGKSLMAVSLTGGHTSGPFGGDGTLVHIDIDPASPNYTKVTVVYEFYAFSQSDPLNGIQAVESYPVFGKDTAGRTLIFLVAEGVKYGNPAVVVPGRPFALTPTDPADWSKAWTYTGSWRQIPWVSRHLARRTIYDATRQRFVWSYHDNSAGEIWIMGKTVGGGDYDAFFTTAASECVHPVGLLLPVANTYWLTCRGYDLYADPEALLPGPIARSFARGCFLGLAPQFRRLDRWL